MTQQENKFNNSSLWCLCQEVLKKRTEEGILLIIRCLKNKPDVKSLNSVGYSVENLIKERGTNITLINEEGKKYFINTETEELVVF